MVATREDANRSLSHDAIARPRNCWLILFLSPSDALQPALGTPSIFMAAVLLECPVCYTIPEGEVHQCNEVSSLSLHEPEPQC